ncbi:MAG: CDP-glucose 4,6-dehydratase [Gammaproteobacteria bacterium]|nr:CDP-glucose 4,6-dehydratase [Gammaproteobacteria bacterium]
MDDLVNKLKIFHGKRVFLTGDTGFKGSWLALWLTEMGANVYGYALPPVRHDAHFNLLNLQEKIVHQEGDIRDLDKLSAFFHEARPEFVFHLAAQALVHKSYSNPKETFDTNVGGSVNLLECVRTSDTVNALVYITSDKCYNNKEWIWGYRENDELGGPDPYSASKAAAEQVFFAYSKSFFQSQTKFGYASVRAGNVIGGGDWSENRVVPDCVRALQHNQPIVLRKPQATRPWQHVLEPLSGYLTLAASLTRDPFKYSGSWNFGPSEHASRSVLEVASAIVNRWETGEIQIKSVDNGIHEAGLLRLNCDKANQSLGWHPRWNFERTIESTIDWYRAVLAGESAAKISCNQIKNYMDSVYD